MLRGNKREMRTQIRALKILQGNRGQRNNSWEKSHEKEATWKGGTKKTAKKKLGAPKEKKEQQ